MKDTVVITEGMRVRCLGAPHCVVGQLEAEGGQLRCIFPSDGVGRLGLIRTALEWQKLIADGVYELVAPEVAIAEETARAAKPVEFPFLPSSTTNESVQEKEKSDVVQVEGAPEVGVASVPAIHKSQVEWVVNSIADDAFCERHVWAPQFGSRDHRFLMTRKDWDAGVRIEPVKDKKDLTK